MAPEISRQSTTEDGCADYSGADCAHQRNARRGWNEWLRLLLAECLAVGVVVRNSNDIRINNFPQKSVDADNAGCENVLARRRPFFSSGIPHPHLLGDRAGRF